MDLRSAIVTAARFCWRGKQQSPMKSIRCIPGTPTDGPALYATSGTDGVLCRVDHEVPNAMFDGEALANAIKGVKGEVRFEILDQSGWMIAGVAVQSGDLSSYPALPVFPKEFHPCPDWWAIEQLLPAVSKDKNRDALTCLHFQNDVVEATDRHRVARAFIQGEWSGLVSAQIFKRMPKGLVEYSFGDGVASFRVGDETRLTSVKRGRFEDCESVLPADHAGSAYRVSRSELEEAAKRVKSLKSSRLDVTFTEKSLDLSGGGWSGSLGIHGIDPYPELPITLPVNTAHLYDVLKGLEVPQVSVGFGSPGGPLRVDAGPLSIGLWGFTD